MRNIKISLNPNFGPNIPRLFNIFLHHNNSFGTYDDCRVEINVTQMKEFGDQNSYLSFLFNLSH